MDLEMEFKLNETDPDIACTQPLSYHDYLIIDIYHLM